HEAEVLPAEDHALAGGQVVGGHSQHAEIARAAVEQPRHHRDERGLPAAARSDQEAQLPEARREVDAAQGLHARLPLPEMLPYATAGHGQAVAVAGHRNTEAGSRTRTRRMLSRLATITTRKMQVPVRATHCHMSTIPRVASLFRVIAKKVAAMPVPREKP